MQHFIPLDDELLYEHPEVLPERLVPFDLDLPCLHQLADRLPEREERRHAS